MTREQQAAMPNVFRAFKAPSKIVAKMAVVDMRKLTGASEYHITYCYNINVENDVEVHIGADTEHDMDARIKACQHILDHYDIK